MKPQTIANTETAVRMRVAGKTYREIAAMLGLSRGRVWQMVRRWEMRQSHDRFLTRAEAAKQKGRP